jgi:HEAT repeat protein
MRKLITWWRIRQLGSSKPHARLTALQSLAKLGDPEAASTICLLLTDEERIIRAAAAETLGKLGNPCAVSPLIRVLVEEKYWEVRYEAVEALRQIGDPAAVNQLVLLLDNDSPDVNLQQIAARALRDFGWDYLSPAQRAMVAILQDDWSVLPSLGPEVIEPIITVLHNGTPRVRRQAADTLGRIGGPAAIATLLRLLADEDANIRQVAAKAIEAHAWQDLDQSQAVRVAIALDKWSTVVGIGPPAIPPLRELLGKAPPATCREAVRVIGRIGGPPAVQALVTTMKQADPSLRQTAADALAATNGAHATEALVAALHDDDFEVAVAAAAALRNADWRPVQPAEEALFHITAGEYTEAARLGPAAIDPLLRALRLPAMRSKVMSALVSIGPTTVPRIIPLLRDDSTALRVCAADALADLGRQQAIPALLIALAEGELSARRAAFAALDRLGWKPADDHQRAELALALDDWRQLPAIGPAALPVLIQAINDDGRADQALHAVEQILQSDQVSAAPLDTLRRLATLVTTPTRAGGLQGRNPEGGKTLQSAVARRRVSQLARAEMQRRGLPV